MIKADLTFKEIDPPADRWCTSGHKAPELFRRGGPSSNLEPTKFFEVTNDKGLLGIVCEPCLIIANHIARLKKKAESKI